MKVRFGGGGRVDLSELGSGELGGVEPIRARLRCQRGGCPGARWSRLLLGFSTTFSRFGWRDQKGTPGAEGASWPPPRFPSVMIPTTLRGGRWGEEGPGEEGNPPPGAAVALRNPLLAGGVGAPCPPELAEGSHPTKGGSLSKPLPRSHRLLAPPRAKAGAPGCSDRPR